MRTATTLLGLLFFAGCGPDFEGDGRVAGYTTTLSRKTVRWTPATAVAVGERFQFADGTLCLFSCTGSRATRSAR
jgi:hypothetical protein